MPGTPKVKSIVFSGLLGFALLCQLTGFDPIPGSQEKRIFSTMPDFPRTWEEVRKYPEAMTNWHKDHFGLRNSLLLVRNWVEVFLLHSSPNPNVILGSGSRLFLSRSLFPDGFEEIEPFSD